MMLLLAALGATAMYGGWYGGLVAVTGVDRHAAAHDPGDGRGRSQRRRRRGRRDAARPARRQIGGWMASGEPMTLGHYRRRDR